MTDLSPINDLLTDPKTELEILIKKEELKKLEIEKLKVEYELEVQKRHSSNKWYLTEYYLKLFVVVFVGLPSLYILYSQILVPTLELQNGREELKWIRREAELIKRVADLEGSLRTNQIEYDEQLKKQKGFVNQLNKEVNTGNTIPVKQKNELSKSLTSLEALIQKKIDKRLVTINLKVIGKKPFTFAPANFDSFQELLNLIYIEHLQGFVAAKTYGKQWVLIDQDRNEIKKIGNIDSRTLVEVGIQPGKMYNVMIK